VRAIAAALSQDPAIMHVNVTEKYLTPVKVNVKRRLSNHAKILTFSLTALNNEALGLEILNFV
jgi:hypothetical protein